jgi:hypothetical protein
LATIWEGTIYHKLQKLREYLELVNKENFRKMVNKLYLICPEYPEQNPVEDIWL